MVRRFGWLLGLFVVVPLFAMVGCECGQVIQNTCEKDSDCTGRKCDAPNGKCVCRDGLCQPAPADKRCKNDADCEPGEICNLIGVCEKTAGCQSNDSCSDGKICCDIGNGKGTQCNFAKCLIHEDCRQGGKNTCVAPITCSGAAQASCIAGACKCEEPCGGADCGSGKCCNASNNKCEDNPSPCPDLKCDPGFDRPDEAKYTVDPKSCNITGPTCECVKRPPLPLGEAGLHSEIGLLGGKVVVSGYNKTYGDLMYGVRQDDGTVKWEFVDGIPAGGTATGAPDGPRGGIEEGGDDVGLHTSLAVEGNNVHISYHDATNGTLKYARKEGDAWKLHVVDKNGTGVGRFTSMTIAGGVPVIAYFVVDDGSGKSALRVARANSAAPNAEGDWTITKVEDATKPACKGQCDPGKKEVCIKDGATFSCQVPSAEAAKCQPTACKDGEEACISGKCMPIEPDDPNPPLPVGVGLFPSVAALPTGGVVIAYYDSVKGDLRFASQTNATDPFALKTLKSKGDVGQFASVAVGPQGRIHIAYINSDEVDLHYLRLNNQFAIDADELVDDGFTNTSTGGEDHFMADGSIVVDAQGVPRIVYQDASVQSLKIAVRKGDDSWEQKKLVGSGSAERGSFGFFADQVIDAGTSYISCYKYNLRDANSSIDIRTWKP